MPDGHETGTQGTVDRFPIDTWGVLTCGEAHEV